MSISYQLGQSIAMGMAVVRVILGAAPFLGASRLARLLGFPADHDTPTARLMARFFGVRDVALGVLVWHALPDPAQLHFAIVFNAWIDASDGVAIAVPLLRRQGIDRAALLCLVMAGLGGLGWALLWLFMAR